MRIFAMHARKKAMAAMLFKAGGGILIGCLNFPMPGGNARAAENGLGHYPVGVSTIMNGMLQPAGGTSLQSYSQYYSSSRLNGPDGNSLDPNFKTQVYAQALRLVHTWDKKLGPFSMASVLMLPVTHVDIRAGGRRESGTGIGDPAISPLYLGYSTPDARWHTLLGMDIYAPLGEYDRNRMANHGLNYWTFAPIFFMTWLPDPRWEVSSTLQASFNTRNTDTHYRSGNSVSIEGVVGYRPSESMPALRVAAQGWASVQYTDDQLNGRNIPDNRGRAFALGPQIAYDIGRQGGGIVLKWQKEFGVRNRSRGHLLWLQFAIPF